MTEPRDDSLDRLLRQTLRQPPAAGATPSCLDAETMAAWMDGGLSGADLAAAEAHAATCSRCRALVAVMARSGTAERHPVEVLASAPQGPRARNWRPWLVPLAAAALVAMAIWIPRRAQQPTQDSTVTLASPAETAPQVLPTPDPIDERQRIPAAQQEAQTAAAKATGPAKAESARADQAEFRRETAAAAAAPEAPPTFRVSPPPTSPVPSVAPETPPPPPTSARGVGFAPPPVPPAPNADALRAPERLASETVVAEFQWPGVLAERVTIDAAARGAAPGSAAGTGPAAGAGGVAGRGGGGRGGAAPRAGVVGATAAPNPPQPIRWRVLASGIVERSNPPGAPWEPVAIEVAGARVTNGAAPSPLVCWLVGGNGLVLLTIDGRSFTRILFPETVDLASVRATSALAATVTTADGRTFETRDGGQTWSRG